MFAQVLPVIALAGFVAARPIASTVLAAVEASVTLPNTTQTNNASFYYQNGNAGACGLYSEDTDLVVGLPLEFYNNTGTVSTYCGSYVVVTNTLNNATVISRVADASATSDLLSLSVATYKALDGDAGLDTVTWRFANETEKAEAVAALISGTSTYTADAVAGAKATTAAAVAAQNTVAAQPKAETTTTAEKVEATTEANVAPKATTTAAAVVEEKKTTEAYVAPKTTTTTTKEWVAPTTTKAYVAPTTQAVVAAAATTTKKAAAVASSGSYSGSATFYYQGGNPGSCGNYNSDSVYIVAVNSAQVAGGAHCGSQVRITNTANGKSVTATVADECPSCSYGSLDLSVGAFDAIGSQSSGVLPISWSWA